MAKSPTLPVSGKITLRGKPLAGATVSFHSTDGKVAPHGTTDAAGLYSLTTYVEKDGAPAGLYKVTIVHTPGGASQDLGNGVLAPMPPDGESFKGQKAAPKSEVPVKLGNPATTDLSFEVKEGSTTFSYDIK